MMCSLRCRTLLCAVVGLLISSAVQAQVLLSDNFTSFSAGTTWQPHGLGLPDQAAAIVGLGADASSLRLGSSPGSPADYRGIETIVPISTAGLPGLQVDVRLRPLNQTGAGNGGGSRASIGVAVLGSTGKYVQASAGANVPDGAPDWADFYDDSSPLSSDSVAFVHFPPTGVGGAEAFRNLILDINPTGTTLTVRNEDGSLNPNFSVSSPLKLADLGSSVTIALRQSLSDSSLSGGSFPENVFGDVDSIVVSSIPEPGSMMLLTLGVVLGALGPLARRRGVRVSR